VVHIAIPTRAFVSSGILGALALVISQLVMPARLAAQSATDSLEVIVAGWQLFKGRGPAEHPAGPTSRVCLESPSPEPPVTPKVSLTVLELLARRLAESYAIEVSLGCRSVERERNHDQTVDRAGRPAVGVSLVSIQFSQPNTAELWISEGSAKLWGRTAKCVVERSSSSAPWRPRFCQTVFQALTAARVE
jgi:hypothetical protein